MPFSISSPYAHSLTAVAHLDDAGDADDDDICPVCDGECTCSRPPPIDDRPLPPIKPSLKIKFTVPHNLLTKKRPPQSHFSTKNSTVYDDDSDDDMPLAGPSNPPLYKYPIKAPLKKRGRPRKADNPPTSSPVHKRSNPKTSIVGRPKKPSHATKSVIPQKPYSKKRPTKKSAPKRRRPSWMDSDISDESSLTDDDDDDIFSQSFDDAALQFPTFVSASALSSMDSGNSSDSSLSSFSDSSMAKEEEGFILSDIHNRARVNRELLADNNRKGQPSQNNDWIIRPRKNSEGPSDVDLDSDATEDDDDDDHPLPIQDPDQDDDEEPDALPAGATALVTGWSEDDEEESSFDADLFFANLSSTEDSDSSSDESMREHGLDDDDTVSDASTEHGLLHMREELENLPLELAESWDGHLVFTNGHLAPSAGGLIDLDFERDASKYILPAPPTTQVSPSQDRTITQDDSDIEMSFGSDDGYEEDGGEADGDTTDEELVGDDDLPNDRAMRLFNFPLSVNSINPLSTVSPMVTPAKRNHYSPCPPDILSRDMGWDSDDMDELFDRAGHHRTLSLSSKSGPGGPRKGVFAVVKQTKQAVIDDSHAGVPSPHPRFSRARRIKRINAIEALLRKHFAATSRHEPSFVPSPTVVQDHHRLLPSIEIPVPDVHSQDTLTTPIDLDDVLNAAFLSNQNADGDADAPPESATGDESDSNHKHLHRWDVISVGAFRQTRENAGIMSHPATPGWNTDARRTPGSSADYGSIMKASPFSTMLWPTNAAAAAAGEKASKRKLAASSKRDREAVARALSSTSPVNRADGDNTPTNGGGTHGDRDHKHLHKSKKELKKERKLKRRSFVPHAFGNHLGHQYHSHHHHPNAKSRSMGSSQRGSPTSNP